LSQSHATATAEVARLTAELTREGTAREAEKERAVRSERRLEEAGLKASSLQRQLDHKEEVRPWDESRGRDVEAGPPN